MGRPVVAQQCQRDDRGAPAPLSSSSSSTSPPCGVSAFDRGGRQRFATGAQFRHGRQAPVAGTRSGRGGDAQVLGGGEVPTCVTAVGARGWCDVAVVTTRGDGEVFQG